LSEDPTPPDPNAAPEPAVYNPEPKTDEQILNEQIAKTEEPEKTPDQVKIEYLEQQITNLRGELEFMNYIYNNVIEQMYDGLDEYAHKIKKSRMKYMIKNKDAIMQEMKATS
jgi:isocitrate lyase